MNEVLFLITHNDPSSFIDFVINWGAQIVFSICCYVLVHIVKEGMQIKSRLAKVEAKQDVTDEKIDNLAKRESEHHAEMMQRFTTIEAKLNK